MSKFSRLQRLLWQEKHAVITMVKKGLLKMIWKIGVMIHTSDILWCRGLLSVILDRFVYEEQRTHFNIQNRHTGNDFAWVCVRLTLWFLWFCRFWWWFDWLWVHIGHVSLWLVLLGAIFGLWCRIPLLSVRVHILISGVSGLNSNGDMCYWFLMADGALDAVRSIWHTEDTLMWSWCNNSHLCLLWHRNPLRPIAIWLQL